eukprot:TRINITY_DN4916_c0_g1_i1.p1 TRINITY_DN4916_c0_g1~~TRINITY_DN4916_c0_g1_i1.p1  ORF type:complete len:605 (+),score=208.06 TRINITY_DN4916_c0_g1_i1:652-2466(+)
MELENKIKQLKEAYEAVKTKKVANKEDLRKYGSVQYNLTMKLFHHTGVMKVPGVITYVMQLLNGDYPKTLDKNGKLILFGHHRDVLDMLDLALSKENVNMIRIDGETPTKIRSHLVDNFQKNAMCRVALLSIKAAGVGITLTSASLVLFAELFWNPGHIKQAEDRVHRIGQKNNVTIEFLVAKGTFDTKLWDLIDKKLGVLGLSLDGKANKMELEGGLTIKEETKEEVEDIVKEFFESKFAGEMGDEEIEDDDDYYKDGNNFRKNDESSDRKSFYDNDDSVDHYSTNKNFVNRNRNNIIEDSCIDNDNEIDENDFDGGKNLPSDLDIDNILNKYQEREKKEKDERYSDKKFNNNNYDENNNVNNGGVHSNVVTKKNVLDQFLSKSAIKKNINSYLKSSEPSSPVQEKSSGGILDMFKSNRNNSNRKNVHMETDKNPNIYNNNNYNDNNNNNNDYEENVGDMNYENNNENGYCENENYNENEYEYENENEYDGYNDHDENNEINQIIENNFDNENQVHYTYHVGQGYEEGTEELQTKNENEDFQQYNEGQNDPQHEGEGGNQYQVDNNNPLSMFHNPRNMRKRVNDSPPLYVQTPKKKKNFLVDD